MTKARSEKIWKYSDITGEWVCYPARERSVQYPGRVFAQRATSGSPVLAIAMSLRSALSYRHYYSDDHPSTTYVIPQSFKTRATKYPVCALHALCVIKHCTCSTAIGQAKPAHLGLRYLFSVKNERCTPTCLLRIHRRRLAAPPIYWPDRLYRAYEPINWQGAVNRRLWIYRYSIKHSYSTETSSRPGLPICSSLNMLRTMTAQCWTDCSLSRLMPSQWSRPCCAAPSLPCGSMVEPTAARGMRRTDFSVKSRLKRLTWPPPTTRASASGRQTWAIRPGS